MTSTNAPPGELPLSDLLNEARRCVEHALDRFLPTPDPTSPVPSKLAEAMRYSVQGGGKRLRPVLALLAAEACGGDWDLALPAACALEFVHAYSLIHDDLPAMDDDDLRRGRPTCHKAFDEATAILAGDALQALAFEVIASHTRPIEASLACIAALASASGPDGMVGGQMADLEAEQRSDASIPGLEAIHRRKTGALLRASLRMGAASVGADADSILALDRYGAAVGLAFQIIDDLLDVQGEEAKLGKRVGKDSGHGKWTYPGLLGVEGSRQRARELAQEAVLAIAAFGDRAHPLRRLAWDLLERDR